jgi:hypothetical protein
LPIVLNELAQREKWFEIHDEPFCGKCKEHRSSEFSGISDMQKARLPPPFMVPLLQNRLWLVTISQ